MTVWYELKTMDGRTLVRTHGLKPEDWWPWIVSNVVTEANCEEDDVDLEESQEGDFITVEGERYAQVLRAIV